MTALAATTTADSATIASYDITTQSDAGQFAIDPSSGVITLAKALDYETKTSHTFTVTATSTDGVTQTQDYTITVSNDDTEGPIVAGSAVVTVNEGVAHGSAVHTVSATDGDGETLGYLFKTVGGTVQNSGGKFAINATTGAITTVNSGGNGGPLSFATAPVHTPVVTVTDASGNTQDQTVTVNVGNVKSTPAFDNTANVNKKVATISESLLLEVELD